MHVDEFIDSPHTDRYASFVLAMFRYPAILQVKCMDLIGQHKLFCTYGRQRYRVTGASRLGDVWLTADFARTEGYDKRVDVAKCEAFSPNP